MTKQPDIFVVCGPGGAGKSTIVSECVGKLAGSAREVVSHTTREPREGEVHGVSYVFETRETFEERIQNGDVLEYTEYQGNYYGLPSCAFDSDDIKFAVTDRVGLNALLEHFGPERVRGILVLPPSLTVLGERMEDQGRSSHEVAKRLLTAEREARVMGSPFDYVLINKDLDRSVRQMLSILELG